MEHEVHQEAFVVMLLSLGVFYFENMVERMSFVSYVSHFFLERPDQLSGSVWVLVSLR